MNSLHVQSTETSGVNVTISDVGESFGDCIELYFKNSLEEDVYLAVWDAAGEDELTKNIFKVFSSAGELYPYTGKMIKRSEPSLKEIIKIPSGGDLTLRAKLNKYYKVTGSIGKISYSAFVPLYTVNDGKVTIKEFKQLDSNSLGIKMSSK